MAHNGGRSQVGFWYMDLASIWPYINVLKQCGQRWDANTTAQLEPTNYTAMGYPKVAAGQAKQQSVRIPSQTNRPGNWVLRWTGRAGFTINGSHTVVSGSLATATNGRAVVDINTTEGNGAQSFGLYCTAADDSIPVTNIEFCHEDDEALLDAGDEFSPLFISKMQEANFGVIRFMDWQQTNVSQHPAAWSDRKPDGYVFNYAPEMRASIYAGSTTMGATDVYTASLTGFVLEDKAKVIVYWDVSCTGTAPTLNVESTGAKVVRTQLGGVMSSSHRPILGRFSFLVYDEELDCWCKEGGDSLIPHMFLPNYAPIESMVRLCNLLGAHPWFHFPHFTADTPGGNKDYVSGLATYCRDNLDAGLIPRFEVGNEVWNPGAGFFGTSYGTTKGAAVWGTGSFHDWYGRAVSQCGAIVDSVFSGDPTKYWMVCAVQTGAGGTNSLATRLGTSGKYVTVDAGDPPYTYAKYLAVANYWGSYPVVDEELNLAWEYSTASAARKLEIVEELVTTGQDISDFPDQNGHRWNMGYRLAEVEDWRAAAAAAPYSATTTFYEGGWSPDYSSSNATIFQFGTITGISRGATTVISIQRRADSVYTSTIPAVGMRVQFQTVGGTTELNYATNGNVEYTVTARDDVNYTFTIAVDSSGYGAWTSGGRGYYPEAITVTNALRAASKASPSLETLTLQFYNDLVDSGCVSPSCYMLNGANQAWAVIDPTIYDTPSPQWDAIVTFNAVGEPEPTPEPTFNLPRGGGSNRNKKKERRYVLEMEDKMYQVSSLEEARAILQSQPVQKKNKTLKLPKLTIELGEVSRVRVKNVPLVKALTMNVPLDWIEDAIQRMEDDEEEAVLLLLH
jgi:hypothetical protein